MDTFRVQKYDLKENEEQMNTDLHLLSEKIELAYLAIMKYEHMMERAYNQMVKPHTFQVRDLVL